MDVDAAHIGVSPMQKHAIVQQDDYFMVTFWSAYTVRLVRTEEAPDSWSRGTT